MKQVYCICCAGAMFFCLFRHLCAVCGRGTARRKTEFCAAAVFLLFFSGAVFCPDFLCRAKKFGLVLYFDTNSRYNKIVFCCLFYGAAAYTLPGKAPKVLPKE